MWKALLPAGAIAILVARASAPPAPADERSSDRAELTRLACEAGKAYARQDLAALERISAEDYTQTDVRGGRLDRAAWLAFVKNRKSLLTIECDEIDVRFYGDAAVVTGRWSYVQSREGAKLPTQTRWTSFWTRYPDGWKRHAFQNTYINPDADRCALEAGAKAR